MIHSNLFPFFRKLEKNNSKTWFNPQKAEYKEMHTFFSEALEELAVDVAAFDPAVERYLDNKGAVKTFRIYRDTRFQKSPIPLKTNISGLISASPEGPFYYVQCGPGDSMAGGGIWMPSSKLLSAIREEISETYEELEAILESKAFKRLYPDGLNTESMVKTAPRGYSVDDPAIHFLRNKNFAATRRFTDKEVTSPDFVELLLDTFEALVPLNTYLTRAWGRMM